MKGQLRLFFVGVVSIAIAAAGLVGSSSIALAGSPPRITSLTITTPVNEGDRPTVTGDFTDPDVGDQHTVVIAWGDGSSDFYTLPLGARSFSLQKSVAFLESSAGLLVQVTLSDPDVSLNRFLSLDVVNVAPSVRDAVRAAGSIRETSPSSTCTFACLRRIQRIGDAMSPGDSAAIATW